MTRRRFLVTLLVTVPEDIRSDAEAREWAVANCGTEGDLVEVKISPRPEYGTQHQSKEHQHE